MKRNHHGAWFLAALFSALICTSAFAAADANPPERMTYQGFLVDGNGNALAPSAPKNYDVIFRIYDSQNGGALKWAEQQTVTVDKGYFSVLLGEGSQVGSEPRGSISATFSGNDASDRFVGITVKGIGANNSDVDILPRLRMLTSPYSFLSKLSLNSVNSLNAANLMNNANAQIVTVNGANVGINKPVPGAALDVVGNSAVSGNSTIAGTATIGGNVTGNNSVIGDVGHGQAWAGFAHKTSAPVLGYALLQNESGQNTLINAKSSPDSSIEFKFDNTMRMKLNNAGSLGIGADPYNSGAGNLKLSGNIAGVDFYDRANPSANGYWALYAANGRAALWSSVGGGDRFSVDTAGNVNVTATFTANGNIMSRNAITTADRNVANASWSMYGHDNKLAFWNNLSQYDVLSIHKDGLIGINGGSPRVPLDVRGYWHVDVGGYGYLNRNGASSATGPYPQTRYSILADERIGAVEFNAFSDRRIKEVVGASDTGKDLETIKKLRVTDYYMIDRVAQGNAMKKGFIAQEVREIVPDAVTTTPSSIPDIYADAKEIKYNDSAKSLGLTMEKPHQLKVGDVVRLITSQASLEVPVTAVSSPTNFVVSGITNSPNQVFVYGKQVKDFLSVSYDRIFTIGVGAIQELAKKVEESKANESRISELEKKASRVDKLEIEIAELKKLVAALAGGNKKVAVTAQISR